MRVPVVSLAAALACLIIASPELKAANLKHYAVERKAAKRFVRMSYIPCRTGWWRSYCGGRYCPRWGTRCR